MTAEERRVPILLWPFYALWRLLTAILGVTGRLLAAVVGLVLMVAGVALTATVVGGINIFGGSGTMIGAVLSLCLIGIVRFGMGLMNVPGQVQSLAIGFLLISAILLPQLGRRLSSGGIRLSRKTVALVIVATIVTAAFAGFFIWSRSLILAPAPTY